MSHIPNRAMPHAAPAPVEPVHAAPAASASQPAPLRPREWLAVGGIAALAGLGAASLGAALVGTLRGR